MKADVHIWTQALEASTHQRLLSETQTLGHEAHLHDTRSTPPRPRPGSVLFLRSTGLDYLDHDIRLAQAWQEKGLIFSVNSLDLSRQLRDKFLGATCLKKLNLPTPPTYLLDDPELIPKLSKEKQGLIVKPRRSNQGKGLFVLDSLGSLKTVAKAWHDLGDTRFVVQPRLKKKREWRVLSLPKQPLLWILRSPKETDQILGNRIYSQESIFKAEKETATQSFGKHLTQTLCALNYWGADVVETQKGEFLVLEVNPSPGLLGAEELTQKNLCRALLTSVFRTLPNQG